MPTVIPPGYAQSAQEFILAGARNPFTVVTGHAFPSPQNANALAGDLRAAWRDEVWAPFERGSNWALGPNRVTARTSAGVLVLGVDGLVTNGTGAVTNSPPSNTAALVRKITERSGRPFRGRLYLPTFGIAETNVAANGDLDPSVRTQITTWMTNWQDAVNAIGARHVLLHSDAVPSDVPPTDVDSMLCQTRMATQRRRMRR